MLVLTTPNIEGKKIHKYLGTVSGSAALGEGLFKDFSISLADVIGGRSNAYEEEFRAAKERALASMSKQAEEMGANAVVAAEFDYQTLQREKIKGSVVLIIITGTAVLYDGTELADMSTPSTEAGNGTIPPEVL